MEHAKKANAEGEDWVRSSALYKEFLAEREEILRHKWLESEKAHHDIGFERALLDWVVKHRAAWRKHRQSQKQQPSQPSEPASESSFR